MQLSTRTENVKYTSCYLEHEMNETRFLSFFVSSFQMTTLTVAIRRLFDSFHINQDRQYFLE